MDEPLVRHPGVGVTVLGTGAIAPGYVLVAPHRHILSIADLPRQERDGFVALLEETRTTIERQFGPAVVFEHGGCDGDGISSQCVAHAHLHVWAVGRAVDLKVPPGATAYADLPAFLDDADRWSGRGYLMRQAPGGEVLVATDVGVPQFFRRQVAAGLGQPDVWDYEAFWFEANMRATSAGFGGRGLV